MRNSITMPAFKLEAVNQETDIEEQWACSLPNHAAIPSISQGISNNNKANKS